MNIHNIVPSIKHHGALVLGSLMALAILAAPTLVFAQCAGDLDISNDGVDIGSIPGIPDYIISDLPETITWTLTPSAGGGLDIDVAELLFALTCDDNGSVVPCTNGNDGQDGNNAVTPLIYSQGGGSGDPTGTCGASLVSLRGDPGVITFSILSY